MVYYVDGKSFSRIQWELNALYMSLIMCRNKQVSGFRITPDAIEGNVNPGGECDFVYLFQLNLPNFPHFSRM